MGQLLHGSATTTEAVRRAIQNSQESVRALASRHGINPTTVQKWKKRAFTHDAAMGPKDVRSTVLTPEEEAACVAFRAMFNDKAGKSFWRACAQILYQSNALNAFNLRCSAVIGLAGAGIAALAGFLFVVRLERPEAKCFEGGAI